MSDPSGLPAADREARRALLLDALSDLARADDPDAAGQDVIRALDSYLEAAPPPALRSPRESPVTDYARRGVASADVRAATWATLGSAAVGTAVVGILLSGWPAAIAILGVWILALAILVSS